MYKQSEIGTLNTTDYKQLGIKLIMIVAALALPAIAEELKLVDFKQYQSIATGIIFMLSYAGQRLAIGK